MNSNDVYFNSPDQKELTRHSLQSHVFSCKIPLHPIKNKLNISWNLVLKGAQFTHP